MWANFGPHGPTRGVVGRVGHSVLRRYFYGYIRSAILCGIRVVLGTVGHRWADGFLELVTMAEPLILLSLQHCNNGCGQWWRSRKKGHKREWHIVATVALCDHLLQCGRHSRHSCDTFVTLCVPPSLRSGSYCGDYVTLPYEQTSCSPGALITLQSPDYIL